MAINRAKALEARVDGFLIEGAVHFSSGTSAPDGSSHTSPQAGDIYFQTNGQMWSYNGTTWVKGLDTFAPEGSNNVYNSAGDQIVSNDYAVIAVGSTRGSGGSGEFVVVAQGPAGGSADVRLYDKSAATQLANINFTETVATRKTAAVSLPATANIIEVQVKKTGGAGVLYSAEVR